MKNCITIRLRVKIIIMAYEMQFSTISVLNNTV